MKALTLKENGGTENLILQERPLPEVGPKDVLVKVKAISINPVDAYVRKSGDGTRFFLRPQSNEEVLIIGWDIAGTVVSKGAEVTEFNVGDDVFGLVNFPGHGKGYAEYVAAPSGHLALMPSNISFEEAAGATLAALTAWQGLVTHANVRAGDRVVVFAAAGGVGHYAVQIAKSLGAYVVAVASTQHHEFLKLLGADKVITHEVVAIKEMTGSVDVVIDSIGGDNIFHSIDILKEGGHLVSLLAFIEGPVLEAVNKKALKAVRMIVESNGKDMKSIANLMEAGNLRSHIAQRFSFEDLPLAHQSIESRKTRGKIVVSLQ